MMRFDDEDGDARARPSRADVETLLILDAIGPEECLLAEVADRLGLPGSVAQAVAVGLESLVLVGLVERPEENRVKVTEAGHVLLRSRLEELGLELRA